MRWRNFLRRKEGTYLVVPEKTAKSFQTGLFRRKRVDQICQKTKVLRRNASKSGTSKPPKPRIFTAKTQSTLRSTRQVRISCLSLRSLRLRGENAFILLRFFTAEKFCSLPTRRNHLAPLIASACIGKCWPRMGFSGTMYLSCSTLRSARKLSTI